MAEEEILTEPAHSHTVGVNWQITTSLMFMVFMSSIGLITWALTSANHAADALQQLADFKVQSALEMRDIRGDTAKQLDSLRADTSVSIGYGIHLDNVEKWIGHADALSGETARRLNDLERQQALLNAQIAGISQASSVRLGPRR
jgi:hypothetical protein